MPEQKHSSPREECRAHLKPWFLPLLILQVHTDLLTELLLQILQGRETLIVAASTV